MTVEDDRAGLAPVNIPKCVKFEEPSPRYGQGIVPGGPGTSRTRRHVHAYINSSYAGCRLV